MKQSVFILLIILYSSLANGQNRNDALGFARFLFADEEYGRCIDETRKLLAVSKNDSPLVPVLITLISDSYTMMKRFKNAYDFLETFLASLPSESIAAECRYLRIKVLIAEHDDIRVNGIFGTEPVTGQAVANSEIIAGENPEEPTFIPEPSPTADPVSIFEQEELYNPQKPNYTVFRQASFPHRLIGLIRQYADNNGKNSGEFLFWAASRFIDEKNFNEAKEILNSLLSSQAYDKKKITELLQKSGLTAL